MNINLNTRINFLSKALLLVFVKIINTKMGI